jgi:hypothetical protein
MPASLISSHLADIQVLSRDAREWTPMIARPLILLPRMHCSGRSFPELAITVRIDSDAEISARDRLKTSNAPRVALTALP